VGGANGQLFAVQRPDDFGGENGFQLLDVGAGMAQVAENIATAADDLNLFGFHPSISFSFFALDERIEVMVSQRRNADPSTPFASLRSLRMTSL
jgi:hypothetical protein